MKRLALLCFMAVAAFSPAGAESVCDRLTAVGVGSQAPKYPKVGADGICDGEMYRMNAHGHDYYWGWDRGGFAYLPIAGGGDFTFTAVLVAEPDPYIQAPKVGIAVREGLVGNDRALQLRWDGFFGGNVMDAQVSWFYRFIPGALNTEFCSSADRSSCFKEGGTGVTVAADAELSIARKNNRYELYVNGTRVAGNEPFVMAGDTVYVGLIASFGGGKNPIYQSVSFSKVECTGACGQVVSAVNGIQQSSSEWQARMEEGNIRLELPASAAGRVTLLDVQGRALRTWRPSRIRNGLLPVPGGKNSRGPFWLDVAEDSGKRRILPVRLLR